MYGSTCNVRVMSDYCGMQGYSDRGVMMYGSTCNVRVMSELLWYAGIL